MVSNILALHDFSSCKIGLKVNIEKEQNPLQSGKYILCLMRVYNGEVHIFQEDLDQFLSIAQRLRLEGLLEDGSETNEQQSTQETNEYIEERCSTQPYEEKPSTPLD